MKLYAFPPSPRARKVMAVLAHLELPYEFQLVDLTKGDQRKPEYLALNPNGRMPTLVDGDFVLWESDAIVQYLAEKTGKLWAADARGRHDLLRWLFWDMAHWDQACAILLFEHAVKGILGLGAADPKEVQRGEDNFKRVGAVLDGHLKDREWVVGDAPTVVDFALAAPLAYAAACRMPVEDFANLKRWFGRVQQLEGWRKTEPKQSAAA